MYNSYLNLFPDEQNSPPPAPQSIPEPPEPHRGSLLSLLSGALGQQKSSPNELLSTESIIVLAALVFLVYQSDGLDTELLILAAALLFFGL